MRTFRWLVLAATIALLTSGGIAQQRAVTPAAPAQVPIGTLRDVMHQIIEESAQVLFNAVMTHETTAGVEKTEPRTDEEWDVIEHNALQLAEAANLLRVPGRRVARPEEENIRRGPTELPPAQIQIRIDGNRALFNKYVNEFQAVAMNALKLVKARNVQGVFDVGSDIDDACENCHLEFWYPDEKPK